MTASGSEEDRFAGLDADSVVGPPLTGDAAIDDTLIGLAELASVPLHEHEQHLGLAHQALQDALERTDQPPGER